MIDRLRRYLLPVMLALYGCAVQADDGWKLLFGAATKGLSEADQLAIYRQLGLTLDEEGTELLVMGGEDAGPARFTVKLDDINVDGRVEVFITGGNSFLSGVTGSSVWLFIKPAPDSRWQVNLGFPATTFNVLADGYAGYPDLRFSDAGSCDVVWRWNGTAYARHEDVATRPGGCDHLL